jgi:hypothetical protein
MGYLIQNVGDIKKAVYFIPEADMQTLQTKPFLLFPINKPKVQFIIGAYITGSLNGTAGTFTFNTLKISDTATLFQARLDLQLMATSTLSTSLAYSFTTNTGTGGQNGGVMSQNKPLYLNSNADDAFGTGDFELTLYYIDLITP